MNREEFYARLAGLDEERLKKALWNLYWRGPVPLRERIEAETAPVPAVPARRPKHEAPDPRAVREEVRQFTALAGAGAYLAGDRRVSPKERTRWRFTFRRLADQARSALAAPDSSPAEEAVADLVDLACMTKSYDLFRSEDPMEAARFVVSDTVGQLWGTVLERRGVSVLAEIAMPQLVRWESRYGWTRTGFGPVSEKETHLAAVLARLLRDPGAWVDCADRYLEALDRAAEADPAHARRAYGSVDFTRRRRTEDLSAWHDTLLDRLGDYDAADRLDRLAAHPALGGPELKLLQARLAHRDDRTDHARELVHEALDELPGHQELRDFAALIGAPLSPRAQEVAARRPH